jgi:hypothetical protein
MDAFVMQGIGETGFVNKDIPEPEQTDSDTELPAVAVMLFGSIPHESVEILIDDQNAKKAISGVIENTYYEGRDRIIDIWPAIEYVESEQN